MAENGDNEQEELNFGEDDADAEHDSFADEGLGADGDHNTTETPDVDTSATGEAAEESEDPVWMLSMSVLSDCHNDFEIFLYRFQ